MWVQAAEARGGQGWNSVRKWAPGGLEEEGGVKEGAHLSCSEGQLRQTPCQKS